MSYQTLTYEDKIKIIDFFEKTRPDLQVLADRFNVGKLIAANIIKNRDSIRNNGPKEQVERKRKSFFNPQGKIIDTSCYEWYLKCIKENKPVTGKLIKEKAISIARSIQHYEFCASNGWLQKWRVRHNVILKPLTKAETELLNQSEENDKLSKKDNVGGTPEIRKNVSKTLKLKKFGVKLPVASKRLKRSFDKSDLEENDLDPLEMNEISSSGSNINQHVIEDDDDILFESENERRFKIDSYASALNAIEDLKNFSQDDDIALNYLNKIERHFQKERLK